MKVRVGDVLRLERRAVAIQPDEEYTLIGVYSFGKGIFHRDPRSGAELGSYRFFQVHPGDLVLSNIQAWEGAIAHATEQDRETIGTHRFLTYVPVDGRIDTSWARYFFLSESGFQLIQRAAPGSVTRNRTLSIDRFESLEIPLPELAEQQRVARSLNRLLHEADQTLRAIDRANELSVAVASSAVNQILEEGSTRGWVKRRLGEVALINPAPARLDAGQPVSFVPMAAVDDVSGTIVSPEDRVVGEFKGYKQFRTGDVIFARITPCMQNGKSAVVRDLPHEYAFGSTEFHVIRPSQDVLPDWIHRVVRSESFRSQAASRFTGTAGQQRVPAAFLDHVEIPVPEAIEEQQAVIEQIDDILERYLKSRRLRVHQLERAKALEPAILNSAFVGNI